MNVQFRKQVILGNFCIIIIDYIIDVAYPGIGTRIVVVSSLFQYSASLAPLRVVRIEIP